MKPKLHNAMWPGLVGKGTDEGQEPPGAGEPGGLKRLRVDDNVLVEEVGRVFLVRE